MALKIHEYANTALTINDQDFYDVDFWDGSQFVTHKISGLTLKQTLSAYTQSQIFTGSNADYIAGDGSIFPFPPIPSPVLVFESINNALVSSSTLLVYAPHFTITPAAGTYLVLINYEVRISAPNQLHYGAIFKNAVNEFERRNFQPSSNQLQTLSLQKFLSFNGTDSLSLRVAMSGGTTTTENKTIILIKLA